MSSVWGQLEPYNNFCPLEYDAEGKLVGRTVVGCVATAMAQIMRYHKYPVHPTGTYTDMQTLDAFGHPIPLTVCLDNYTFDYSLMRDSYTPGNYVQAEADQAGTELCLRCVVRHDIWHGLLGHLFRQCRGESQVAFRLSQCPVARPLFL